MRALVVQIGLGLGLVAGCGAGFGVPPVDSGSGNPSDAPGLCGVEIEFDPAIAHAGSGVLQRAIAVTDTGGVLSYQWFVTYNGGTTVDSTPIGDGGAIDFLIETAGTYDVQLAVTSDIAGNLCTTDRVLNVLDPDANVVTYRARVTPPPSTGAPPYEQQVHVTGGGNQAINLSYPQVSQLSGTVSFQSAPTPAYIQISPPNTSTFVDSFTDASGQFGPLTVLGGAQDILIVPSVAGPAPSLVHWDPTKPTFFGLTQGTAVTGHVGVGAGNLGGAQVQLLLGGRLPSTLTTTAADGSFTVFADMSATDLLDSVTVVVQPPASSGLPRLTTTAAIDLGQPVNVAYGAVTKRDLAGTAITIGGAPATNAKVILASPIIGGGTIANNAAAGALRVQGATNGAGTVASSLIAPATAVSIVVQPSGGIPTITTIDLTAGVPASIDLPALQTHGGIVTDINAKALDHAIVEVAPAGALAIAGVPSIQTFTDETGAYVVQLAPQGDYDFRVVDLTGSGPLHSETGIAASAIGDVTLDGGLRIDGVVQLPDLSPAAGASVQFLCFGCTGVGADKPVAESATDFTGTYHVGIADPGTGSGS